MVFHFLDSLIAIGIHSYTLSPVNACRRGACQTKIPPQAAGERFEVKVRPVSDDHKTQEPRIQRFPEPGNTGVKLGGFSVLPNLVMTNRASHGISMALIEIIRWFSY